MKENNYDALTNYIIDHQQRFYRLAYSYAGNEADALDIVQNAICKALRWYQNIQNIEYLRTWFYRVLVNECMDFLKKKQDEVPCEEILPKESYYEKAYEPEGTLFEEVNKLPAEIQMVIKLRFYEELSLKEIAQCTGANLNTVKARLYRGLRALKKEVVLNESI